MKVNLETRKIKKEMILVTYLKIIKILSTHSVMIYLMILKKIPVIRNFKMFKKILVTYLLVIIKRKKIKIYFKAYKLKNQSKKKIKKIKMKEFMMDYLIIKRIKMKKILVAYTLIYVKIALHQNQNNKKNKNQ